MRSRDRILTNLEAIYRESYDRAKTGGETARMIDLESAYMRDQLMLEILLDIRDLFSVAPAAAHWRNSTSFGGSSGSKPDLPNPPLAALSFLVVSHLFPELHGHTKPRPHACGQQAGQG